MNLIERGLDNDSFYRLLGIRKEYPELNPVAAALMVLRSRVHVLTHRSVFEGHPLPTIGPGLVLEITILKQIAIKYV